MTLTLTEAENILSRVFSDATGGPGQIQIDPSAIPATAGSPMLKNAAGDYYISRDTLVRVIRAMGRQGLKIEAIKLYREIVPGTGLAEAKNHVETVCNQP